MRTTLPWLAANVVLLFCVVLLRWGKHLAWCRCGTRSRSGPRLSQNEWAVVRAMRAADNGDGTAGAAAGGAAGAAAGGDN